MLYDHRFPEPASKRPSNFIERNWLPLAVVSASLGLLTAGLLGISPGRVWFGSTILSGFVLSYSVFVLIRSQCRSDIINAKIESVILEVARRDQTNNSTKHLAR